MQQNVFLIALALHFLLGASLVFSIVYPQKRIWPPPGKWTWQFFYTWGITGCVAICYLILGISEFSGFKTHSMIGGIILLAGEYLRFQSIHALGISTGLGLKGTLITKGPYAWSRNPMYIADITALLGITVFFHTPKTWILFGIWSIWFLLAPLAEEPWLKKQYGTPYREYMQRVPRWFTLSKAS